MSPRLHLILAATALLLSLAATAHAAPSAAATMGRRGLLGCVKSNCKKGGWPQPYSSYLELYDVNQACDAVDNSCCDGCWDYENFSAKVTSGRWAYSDKANPGQQPDVKAQDHVLVLPRGACTGVESYNTPACDHEYIWDATWDLITKAGLQQSKAAAINSMHHRTQHQMHVHVADLQAGVKAWLQNTPGLGQNPDGKPHAADCVFNSHANILCTPNSAGHTTATCTAGATPSAVQPFKTTYHYPPQPAIAGYTGTLVYSPKAGTFCVVSFDDKPVKCMLYCPISNQCNTNPKVKCP